MIGKVTLQMLNFTGCFYAEYIFMDVQSIEKLYNICIFEEVFAWTELACFNSV